MLVLFCHEDSALVRAYSHVRRTDRDVQIGAMLSIINDINHEQLLDAYLDYSAASHTVRVRSTFRTLGQGLPTVELRKWINMQLVRGDYFSKVFDEIDLDSSDPKSELDRAREKVRKYLGLEFQPDLE